MIKAAAAIDDKQGLATDHGIPWDLPSDRAHERAETMGGAMLMGYNTYREFEQPPPGRTWYVLTDGKQPLRSGFNPVTNLKSFLDNPPKNLWIFGGAGVFAQTIDAIDELHLTHIKGDFDCTKFFPDYKDKFTLVSQTKPQTENGTTFYYAIYKRHPA